MAVGVVQQQQVDRRIRQHGMPRPRRLRRRLPSACTSQEGVSHAGSDQDPRLSKDHGKRGCVIGDTAEPVEPQRGWWGTQCTLHLKTLQQPAPEVAGVQDAAEGPLKHKHHGALQASLHISQGFSRARHASTPRRF